MRKIIKKILNETIDETRLKGAYVWINNYLDSLEEFVDDRGNIHLFKQGNKLSDVLIKTNSNECWVGNVLWNELSQHFLLDDFEVDRLVSDWVEYTYKMKGVKTMKWGIVTYNKDKSDGNS